MVFMSYTKIPWDSLKVIFASTGHVMEIDLPGYDSIAARRRTQRICMQLHGSYLASTTETRATKNMDLMCFDGSGQIIATSQDLTPNGGLVGGIPLFQGNLGW